MYKRASQNLTHAHRIDAIDPSKGFVWRDSDTDLIPSASNMGLFECRNERRQLSVELAKLETGLAMAKRTKDSKQAEFLGYQKASLCARMAAVKDRTRELMADKDFQLLTDAVNAVCEESVKSKIFEYARINRNAYFDGLSE